MTDQELIMGLQWMHMEADVGMTPNNLSSNKKILEEALKRIAVKNPLGFKTVNRHRQMDGLSYCVIEPTESGFKAGLPHVIVLFENGNVIGRWSHATEEAAEKWLNENHSRSLYKPFT